MLTFERYQSERYFYRLDGLRALSILLVLLYHSRVSGLDFHNGHTGVTLFFVISGYLITTLLVREEARKGGVRLGAFYIRRVFRLLPLYYVALAVTTLAVVAGFGSDGAGFWARMPYFLTYMNEFASPGTFGHTWSLAVEEKFYFVWPLLAFAVPVLARRRAWLAVGLVAMTSLLGLVAPQSYVGVYAPILAGCLLAIIMSKRTGFAVAARIAQPSLGLAAALVLVLAIAFAPPGDVQVIVGLASMLAFPFFLLGNDRLVGWLAHRSLTYIGERAYAIYLFHPLIGRALEKFLPVDRHPVFEWAHLLLMFALSLVVAEILRRTVENPMRKLGHRFAGARTGRPASSHV